ncbi:MAG: amidohydrolase family protein [bacterium]|nr:amidohydrolase family protein [bacterium]
MIRFAIHAAFGVAIGSALAAQGGGKSFAVRADIVHTMAGRAIEDGIVIVRDGKITAVGKAATIRLPAGIEQKRAKVLVPGLIDAHATVGLTGHLNIPHDQDQLDSTGPVQPELRAIDAYNAHDPLVNWLRSFGITTVHTGHAPRALVAGQTMVVKTHGRSVEKDVLRPFAMIACTLGDAGRAGRGDTGGKKPGTRAKSAAMLREALLAARAYAKKCDGDDAAPVELRHEAFAAALRREVPLLVTAHRAHDLMTTLRIAKEFELDVVLDGAAEAYLLLDEIKASKCTVLPHPAMARTRGELGNATMELPKLLVDAGIPIALQSGFESYVPKSRVVLFEAGVAVSKGLADERALAALTIGAARLLGVADRIGSLEVGKDADLAWFDGDPFEYTTNCLGVMIDGVEYPGERPLHTGR